MTLSISEGLKKEIVEYFASLSPHDLKMLEINTKKITNRLRAAAQHQPTGSLAGRWEDRGGVAPNELNSDDSNP